MTISLIVLGNGQMKAWRQSYCQMMKLNVLPIILLVLLFLLITEDYYRLGYWLYTLFLCYKPLSHFVECSKKRSNCTICHRLCWTFHFYCVSTTGNYIHDIFQVPVLIFSSFIGFNFSGLQIKFKLFLCFIYN